MACFEVTTEDTGAGDYRLAHHDAGIGKNHLSVISHQFTLEPAYRAPGPNLLASRQASLPWSADHRFCRPEDSIANGAKIPKSFNIHICPASAANDSGSLQT